MEHLQNMDTATLVQLYENAEYNSHLKLQLEIEISRRKKKNTKYSLEDIFHINKTLNKVITLFLYPSSDSYKIIGNNVTINLNLSKTELGVMLKNAYVSPVKKTYGKLSITVLNRSLYDKSQLEEIEKIGIDTEDIYEITTR